ncbi:CNNM domain-containing protein [Alphaproteobacteria bacterium]|nr:CNNM domain-containing protein [Alphaproteobacteria bacterium]
MNELSIFLIIIAFLIVCSAFFSSSETALTAVSEARINELVNKGNKKAKLIEKILKNRDKMIGTILIGNNFVNIIASVYATSFAIQFFTNVPLIVITIILTIILVIFAEMIPKTYALKNADEIALTVSPLINLIIIFFTPLTFLTEKLSKLITGPDYESEEAKTEELKGMIRLHAGKETRAIERGKIMSSMIDIEDVNIEEVMTHRGVVTMIDINSSSTNIYKIVGESPYTRIPVFSGTQDNIIGILHAKELFRFLQRNKFQDTKSIDLKNILIDPYFAPETTPILDQLEIFRGRKEHFAIVVNEYGDFRGIVTLEDILEEIVGEIDDETDINVEGVKSQPDGSLIIDGSVTIRDLNRSLAWDLPDENYNTIAGLVVFETKTIPNPGQEFRLFGIKVRILQKDKNFLSKLRLWKEQ